MAKRNPLRQIKQSAQYFLKEYRHHPYYRAHFEYAELYEKTEIVHDTVLIQSYDGTSVSCNPYYLMRELCTNPEYRHLTIFVVAAHKQYRTICAFLKAYGFSMVHVVLIHSKEYCQLLASAEYLITNSTFPPYFMKKDGQKLLNTWHGTPLKPLGRKIYDSPNEIGNTQRNFLMSDYLLCPNELTLACFRDDYMLRQYYQGTYVLSDYPRNDAFFDKESAFRVREELGLEGKKVYAYMPTWRGSLHEKKVDAQYIAIMNMLYELDKAMDNESVLFVKLHSITNKKIPYADFKHIQAFPTTFETYEFLNACDCLITDYSSVLFDYMNTQRKIILFAYDKDEYFKNKEPYIDYNALPFPIVTTATELRREMAALDKFENYETLLDTIRERERERERERDDFGQQFACHLSTFVQSRKIRQSQNHTRNFVS